MPLPTLVFDLDGTLIDTAPDLIDTLNVIFAGEGMPPVPYDTARMFIGGGARAMIVRGYEAEKRKLDANHLDTLVRTFIAYYSNHIADRSRPFPGLIAALDALASRGYRFAVCTNKLEGLSRQLLNALKLADRFDAICGQDTFGTAKPDPEVLRRTILEAGGDPAHAIMIGDSETDILTAQAASLPVIAVDFGYSEQPVANYMPNLVISHYDQLLEAIAKLSPER